jgi:hypothetical protein
MFNLNTLTMKKALIYLPVILMLSCNSGNDEDKNDGTMKDTANDVASSQPVNAATDKGYKKYEIKSGIVFYEVNMEVAGMSVKSARKLYFDDFGLTECEEEYKKNEATGKDELDTRTFVKDGMRYSYSPSYKNGSTSKALGYGVAAIFNMDEARTLKENNFRELPGETVCGKQCQSFSIETGSGKLIMSGWKGIALKTVLDNPSSGMKSVTQAVRIQENAAIPAEIFTVPDDIKLVSM